MNQREELDVTAELVALAHGFAVREMRPRAAECDEEERFPTEVVQKAAELGLHSFDIPAEYGGGGIGSLEVAIRLSEELAWGDSGMAGCIGGGSFFAKPVLALGTEEQKRRWLPMVTASDPVVVGALATTEPNAGSDAAAIRTRARRVAGGYRIDGQKTWISNAPEAGVYVVFASTAPALGAKGVSAFVLEKGDPGFELGRKLPKMGSRCFPAGELFFDDCHVDEDRRLGEEGAAFRGLMEVFDRSRVMLAANAVGIGRAALEYAVEYARERTTFGRPIHEYQAVSFRLVDAKLRLDQARLLAVHAARLADAGAPYTTEAAMAKVAAAEAAWFSCWAAVQTLGGFGYSREYPVERWLRAAKLEEIYEGTSDIQRLVIARELFGRKRAR